MVIAYTSLTLGELCLLCTALFVYKKVSRVNVSQPLKGTLVYKS